MIFCVPPLVNEVIKVAIPPAFTVAVPRRLLKLVPPL